MPTTSELLLRWDATRDRSQQTDLGWSEVGGCRRRAGYRLSGTKPTNPSGSVQAVMGTAVHDAIAAISASFGLVAETEVTFAGIRGHYDRVEGTEVVDVKTVGTDRFLEHIELHGPPQPHVFQIHGYAAGLLVQGADIRSVRIDYLARDTGREWAWRSRFDPQVVKEALAWLRQVRDTEVEMLPRDYLPDTAFCLSCPFFDPCWAGAVPERDKRSVMFVEDPDAARYADELFEVRKQIAELKATEANLRGVLDAIRPDDGGQVDTGRRLIEFRPTRGTGWAIYFRAHSTKERS